MLRQTEANFLLFLIHENECKQNFSSLFTSKHALRLKVFLRGTNKVLKDVSILNPL